MISMISNLKKHVSNEAIPGILLCVATIIAIMVENSMLSGWYHHFKEVHVLIRAGDFEIDKSLLHWINDGLMALFFLLVGLEIKREILEGHLSVKGQLLLPMMAALGGLAVPALIYAFINQGSPTIHGWAIPSATDIAFALGVILLLGNRIPPALKVSLVALAILDDLAAIIIIAFFYTADTSVLPLLLAGLGLSVAFIMNRRGVTSLGPYLLIGMFVWGCVLKSGVHATLAGVALGLIIPMRVNNGKDKDKSPLMEMEHTLYPFVSFCVLPLFAFVNAGVSLKGLSFETFGNPITLGIVLGLFFGKQIGVMLATFIGVSLKLFSLPKGVCWKQYYGMAVLTGIGFTMSLFIGTLAFNDIEHIAPVRLGVLTGSMLSAILGICILLLVTKKPELTEDPESLVADEQSY